MKSALLILFLIAGCFLSVQSQDFYYTCLTTYSAESVADQVVYSGHVELIIGGETVSVKELNKPAGNRECLNIQGYTWLGYSYMNIR